MSRRRSLASWLLMALLWLAFPAQAAPAPIVFDFEDGLQGWELQGAATRVQTQVLGGEWAILGDGIVDESTAISIEIDLMEMSSMSVDFSVFDAESRGLNFFTVEIEKFPSASGGFFTMLDPLNEPIANPGRLDVSFPLLTKLQEFPDRRLRLTWTRFSGVTCTRCSAPEEGAVGFIDNITFHPVPEPGTLALLAGSLMALVMARRRML